MILILLDSIINDFFISIGQLVKYFVFSLQVWNVAE